ncbi:MAG: hypothetical protein RLZZ123_676 [Pseudomonadota bacterium]|jgi:hypothetical protein
MTPRTGRCLCGAVTFKLTADPIVSRICWCRDCQHISANGTVNAVFSADAFEVQGPLTEYAKKADSGNTNARLFCPTCGSHVYGYTSLRPNLRVIRVGALDDPSSIAPQQNIWTASAPDWACLNQSIQQVAGQSAPPPPDVPRP